MNTHQSVFELWNYSFLFMTLSTLVVFFIDMLGHKTKTISSNVFSLTVVLAITVGELVVSFAPIANINLRLAISIFLIVFLSALIPLKFRTIDPEVKKRIRPEQKECQML